MVRFAAVELSDVSELDTDLLLRHLRIAELPEPYRGAGAAAGGIDHEVRVQRRLRRLVTPVPDTHAGYPTLVRRSRQACDVAAVDDRHPGQRRSPGTDGELQELAAHRQPDQPGRFGSQQVSVEVPVDVRLCVGGHRACCDQLVMHPGEEFLIRLTTPGEQTVQVTTLWHATTRGRFSGQLVPVDQRHALETLAEHPGRAETPHRGTDDDGMSTRRDRAHRNSLRDCVRDPPQPQIGRRETCPTHPVSISPRAVDSRE
jgi:hypothetical protein